MLGELSPTQTAKEMIFGDVVHNSRDCFETYDATETRLRGYVHALRAGSGRELGDARLSNALGFGAGYLAYKSTFVAATTIINTIIIKRLLFIPLSSAMIKVIKMIHYRHSAIGCARWQQNAMIVHGNDKSRWPLKEITRSRHSKGDPLPRPANIACPAVMSCNAHDWIGEVRCCQGGVHPHDCLQQRQPSCPLTSRRKALVAQVPQQPSFLFLTSRLRLPDECQQLWSTHVQSLDQSMVPRDGCAIVSLQAAMLTLITAIERLEG